MTPGKALRAHSSPDRQTIALSSKYPVRRQCQPGPWPGHECTSVVYTLLLLLHKTQRLHRNQPRSRLRTPCSRRQWSPPAAPAPPRRASHRRDTEIFDDDNLERTRPPVSPSLSSLLSHRCSAPVIASTRTHDRPRPASLVFWSTAHCLPNAPSWLSLSAVRLSRLSICLPWAKFPASPAQHARTHAHTRRVAQCSCARAPMPPVRTCPPAPRPHNCTTAQTLSVWRH